jgi:hypothetical protein
VLQKHGQYLEGLFLQLDLVAVFMNLAGGQIHVEWPEPDF